mgnify:CR=1 FL=1
MRASNTEPATEGSGQTIRPKPLLSALVPLIAGITAISPLARAAESVTSVEYLQSRDKPQIRDGHRLVPLSLAPGWGNTVPFELRKELADNWGWGLYFGRVNEKNVEAVLNDPSSSYSRIVQLAKSDPDRYPLDVMLNTQNYFRSEKHVVSREKTPGAYLRDSSDVFLGKNASPETPDSVWDKVIADLTSPLKRLADEEVKFNVIQHWAEWFIPVWGWGGDKLKQDPRVVAAMLAIDTTELHDHPHYGKWNLYLHKRRAYYEGRLADTVKAIAPNRNSYNWYGLCGGTHYGRYGGYDNWDSFQFGVGGAETINDYPGASLYRPDNGNILNSGGTDNNVNDLLSRALAAKGVEIAHGCPLNQSWVWIREDKFGVLDQYIGYVKCLYTLGMVGCINFLMPDGAREGTNYSYAGNEPFYPDRPPTWLRQIEAFSRVHALFSYLGDFIHDGELIEGPHRHIYWAQHRYWGDHEPNPGYVLDNPYEVMRDAGGAFGDPRRGKVRVVARRKPDGELLVCAWAADDTTREVEVTLPDRTSKMLTATPQATLYRGFSDDLVEIDNESVSVADDGARGQGLFSLSMVETTRFSVSRKCAILKVSGRLGAGTPIRVSVYSIRGSCLQTATRKDTHSSEPIRIDLPGLPGGRYVIRLQAQGVYGSVPFVLPR